MIKIVTVGAAVFGLGRYAQSAKIAELTPERTQVFEVIFMVDLLGEWCQLLLRKIEDGLAQLIVFGASNSYKDHYRFSL